MREPGDVSERQHIKLSARQDCVFFPYFFNIFSQTIKKSLRYLEGKDTSGQNLSSHRRAFTTAPIADSDEKLQFLLEQLVGEREHRGFKLKLR